MLVHPPKLRVIHGNSVQEPEPPPRIERHPKPSIVGDVLLYMFGAVAIGVFIACSCRALIGGWR